jgi:hypothetical protein
LDEAADAILSTDEVTTIFSHPQRWDSKTPQAAQSGSEISNPGTAGSDECPRATANHLRIITYEQTSDDRSQCFCFDLAG